MTKKPDPWFLRYKFLQPLGQGGMGTVYLAEDLQNNNALCVVKQLNNKNEEPEEQKEGERLFKREIEILEGLDHRGIVHIFDKHVSKDDYFLVMDYIPGKNLETVITQYGPFNSEATVEIGIQCCEVLEYLHERNPPVIYRDLKPSNLMLTPEGEIVFIDFGIARTFMPKQSATRVVTAGYSPPEQYFGRPETRSDLYAMGATLGHLLTGQRPKPLSTSSPRLLKHDVLLTLDDLIKRLTAHNPEDRPLNAREVRYEMYSIYQEIHPDFEIPHEALMALEKLSLVRGVLQSQAFKDKQSAVGVQQVDRYLQDRSGEYNSQLQKEYDTTDLQKLTKNKAASNERRLNTRPKTFIERFKSWLSNIR